MHGQIFKRADQFHRRVRAVKHQLIILAHIMVRLSVWITGNDGLAGG